MNSYKVFLSSSQFNDEFKIEREALFLIFDKEIFRDRFKLWQIEDYSSPVQISKHYIENVNSSDILLLLIGDIYREAVHDEYIVAKNANKKIFCFIKKGKIKQPENIEFIKEIRKHCTTSNYTEFKELSAKIENSFTDYFYLNKENEQVLEKKDAEKLIMNKNERALRILVGIFDSGNKEPTVEIILQKYIEEILNRKDSPLNIQEIKHLMSQLLPELSESLFKKIDELVIQLEKNNQLVKINDKYKFPAKTVKKNTKKKELEIEAIKGIFSKYEDVLEQDFIGFKESIENCICQIIFKTASNTATVSLKGDFSLDAYDKNSIKEMITNEISLILDNHNDIGILESVIYEILSSNDIKIIKWINKIYKSYWILTLLDQNPEVIDYQKRFYERYVIYLDSHMVIRIIVNAGSDANLCIELFRLCKKLHIELRLADSLYNEVEKSFYSANLIYKRSGGDIVRANELFNTLEKKSDILDGYLLEKKNNENLSWNAYINRYYSPIKKNKLRNYLQNELGIIIQERKDFSEEQWAKIESIKEILLEKRHVHACSEDSLDYERYNRELILRTNEARQISIIYQQRLIEEDKDFWFLTFDQYVYRTNAELLALDDQMYDSPCYIKPARLLEMLIQVPDINGDINAFRSILLSDDLQRIANEVDIEVISEMLDKRIDKTITDKNTLLEMYSDIVSRPVIEEAYRDYVSAEDDIEKDTANKNIIETISNVVLERLQYVLERNKNLEQEVIDQSIRSEKLRKRTKYYKAELTRKTKKK